MVMITSKAATAVHRAVTRIMAHLMGTSPLEVWPTYRTFEDDTSILVDILGVLEDSAKPYLEERARKVRTAHGRPDGKAEAASSLVRVPTRNSLDTALAEQVDSERGVDVEEGINHLDNEE